jgi:hypothetical protein
MTHGPVIPIAHLLEIKSRSDVLIAHHQRMEMNRPVLMQLPNHNSPTKLKCQPIHQGMKPPLRLLNGLWAPQLIRRRKGQ